MTINENDCDLRVPDVSGRSPLPEDQQQRIGLHSKLYSWSISHGRVVRVLRDCEFLSEDEVEKLGDKIQAQYDKMATLTQPNAQDLRWHLDCHVFVDSTKFRMIRHNLTPNAPFAARSAALRRCILLAKQGSVIISEKFKDETISLDAHEHNANIVRIVFPEHCQYLFTCAMYLIVAEFWNHALPFILALRAIGDKLPVNRACCRYLWGVINLAGEAPSVYRTLPKKMEGETFWSTHDEEILAMVAADMHQDVKAWEAVWQKVDSRKPHSSSDVSTIPTGGVSGEMKSEHPEDSPSVSDSDLRSEVKTSIITSEGESTPYEQELKRPESTRYRIEEEETWEKMVEYIRERRRKSQKEPEDINNVELEQVSSSMSVDQSEEITSESHKDAIQRRMSIANLL